MASDYRNRLQKIRNLVAFSYHGPDFLEPDYDPKTPEKLEDSVVFLLSVIDFMEAEIEECRNVRDRTPRGE